MPMVRAMRLLNAIEVGTTSGAALETLLADPGRLGEWQQLLVLRGQMRRMAASSTAMTAVAASSTAMTAAAASSTAMAAVEASSTAINAVGAVLTSLKTACASTYSNLSKWVSKFTWTARTLPSSSNWRSVTYGNGLFVAVESGGTAAATSPDGVTWTARTLPSSSNWYSVTYGNGLFVAVASGSTAAMSTL